MYVNFLSSALSTHTVEGFENNRNICKKLIYVFLFTMYIYYIYIYIYIYLTYIIYILYIYISYIYYICIYIYVYIYVYIYILCIYYWIICIFLDQHLQPIMKTRQNLRLHEKSPKGAILVTADVAGLYPSIPHSEGLNIPKSSMKSIPIRKYLQKI